jgi:hypothetical protein
MDKKEASLTLNDQVLDRNGIDADVTVEQLHFFDGETVDYLQVLIDPSGTDTKEEFFRKLTLIPRVWYGFKVFVTFAHCVAYAGGPIDTKDNSLSQVHLDLDALSGTPR